MGLFGWGASTNSQANAAGENVALSQKLSERVEFTSGHAKADRGTLILASFTDHLDGSPGATTLRHFKPGRSNCLDGHSLLDKRDLSLATSKGLEEAERRGFQRVEILSPTFSVSQFGTSGMVDLMFEYDEILNGPMDSGNPKFRAFVGTSTIDDFQKQMEGVSAYLAANPDSKLRICYRSEYSEQEGAFRAALST